jgi:hypothetical protein
MNKIGAIGKPPSGMKDAWYDFKSNVLLADNPGLSDFRDTCRAFYAGALVLSVLLARESDADDEAAMARIAKDISDFLFDGKKAEP